MDVPLPPQLDGLAALEAADLFRFDRYGEDPVSDLLDHVSKEAPPPSEEHAAHAYQQIWLSAAEFSLATLFASAQPAEGAVPVGAAAARLSIVKAGCTIGDVWACWPQNQPFLAAPAIFAFGGDARKFGRLGGDSGDDRRLRFRPQDLHEDARMLVEHLDQLHRANPVDWVRRVAESGLVHLQGTIWTAKASVSALLESHISALAGKVDVRTDIDRYLSEYPVPRLAR